MLLKGEFLGPEPSFGRFFGRLADVLDGLPEEPADFDIEPSAGNEESAERKGEGDVRLGNGCEGYSKGRQKPTAGRSKVPRRQVAPVHFGFRLGGTYGTVLTLGLGWFGYLGRHSGRRRIRAQVDCRWAFRRL